MEFRTAYERKEHDGIVFDEPSLTQQQFKEECDINNIIARYETTGLLTDPLHPGTRQPMFGDFSNVMDYQAAQNIVVRANEAFEALPAKLRDRFDNDPALMLEFLQDENNREEAVKLGLVKESVSDVNSSSSGNSSSVDSNAVGFDGLAGAAGVGSAQDVIEISGAEK